MSIFDQKASAGRSTEAPTEANHSGALIAIIDLGTHTETYTDNKTGKTKDSDVRKVFLVFELDEQRTDGGNHVIAKEYTLSTGPKAGLRKMMEGWRGKAYQEGEEITISKALGRACLVNVTHKTSSKGTQYAKLEAIAPLPKGMTPFKPTYTPIMWEIGCGKPIPSEKWMPDSFLNGQFATIKQIIEASKEMKPLAAGQTGQTAPPPSSGMAPPPSQDEAEVPF